MSIQTKYLCILFLFLWGVVSISARAEDNNIVITKVRKGDTISLIAKLDNCSEATLTLTATLTNMVASVPMPLTVDLTGQKQTVLVVVFKAIHPNQPFDATGKCSWQPGLRSAQKPQTYVYSLPYRSGPFEVIQGAHGTFSHQIGSEEAEAVDWGMPVGT
ncbi:MAG TPA: hypothetical protein VKU00_16585, partial [Chthonomonadaceae bacterium]|nr:hypothetical protein [Chthonomonadaceae bacterium]